MTEKKEEINDRDKPFILALVASAITILNIALAAIGAYTDNQLMVTTSIDTLKFTFPLTMAAWVYYFGKQ
jgi:hypothetical protein